MKFKMAPNSLFAVLLRSPWWISIGIAVAFAAIARLALPPQYMLVGAMGGIPFLGIGLVAAWRQFRAPSGKQLEATLQAVSAMSWKEFSAALEAAFAREGYAVQRLGAGAADLALSRAGRTSLVSARRWKAANPGVEPLRELQSAGKAQDVSELVYVTLGSLSDNAARFAREHGVRVLGATDVAMLLRRR